jgi:hypothetical protein
VDNLCELRALCGFFSSWGNFAQSLGLSIRGFFFWFFSLNSVALDFPAAFQYSWLCCNVAQSDSGAGILRKSVLNGRRKETDVAGG